MKRSCPWVLILLAGCATTGDGGANAWKMTNSSVHEKLARSALERGRLADACAGAREALRVDPNRPEATLILARALLLVGAPEEAEDAARHAVELVPDDAEAWLIYAETALARDREVEARTRYGRAVALGSLDARLILGSLELADGNEKRGVVLLEGLPGEHLATAETLEVLATHHWMAGRPDRALELLERAIAMNPGDRGLLLKLEQIWFSIGAEADVLELHGQERSIGRFPSTEESCLAAAGLLRTGRFERAAAEYRRLARQLPNEPDIRLALGEALLGEGDTAGAEAAFQAASRLDPASRGAWVGLARSRLSGGRAAEALAPLETALNIDPTHAPTRSLLAAASARSGDLARARREASEVRILAPGSELDHACRRMLQRMETETAEEDPETQ